MQSLHILASSDKTLIESPFRYPGRMFVDAAETRDELLALQRGEACHGQACGA
jgi:hypothetical protein